jgi:hypothetical protein
MLDQRGVGYPLEFRVHFKFIFFTYRTKQEVELFLEAFNDERYNGRLPYNKRYKKEAQPQKVDKMAKGEGIKE